MLARPFANPNFLIAGDALAMACEDQGDIAGGPGPGDTFGRAPRRTPMSLGPAVVLSAEARDLERKEYLDVELAKGWKDSGAGARVLSDAGPSELL